MTGKGEEPRRQFTDGWLRTEELKVGLRLDSVTCDLKAFYIQ